MSRTGFQGIEVLSFFQASEKSCRKGTAEGEIVSEVVPDGIEKPAAERVLEARGDACPVNPRDVPSESKILEREKRHSDENGKKPKRPSGKISYGPPKKAPYSHLDDERANSM